MINGEVWNGMTSLFSFSFFGSCFFWKGLEEGRYLSEYMSCWHWFSSREGIEDGMVMGYVGGRHLYLKGKKRKY